MPPLLFLLVTHKESFCFLFPQHDALLEVLVPEGEMLPPGNKTTIPLEREVKTATCPFWVLMPLNQQAKKGVTVLAVVIGPDCQAEVGLFLHSGGKERMSWDTGDPFSLSLLVVPWLVIKVSGKLQQRRPGRTTKDPEP